MKAQFFVMGAILLFVLGCTPEAELKAEPAQIKLQENEFIVPAYSYWYLRNSESHSCRGIKERLELVYQNATFIIAAENVTAGPVQQLDYTEACKKNLPTAPAICPPCGKRGELMLLHTSQQNTPQECETISHNGGGAMYPGFEFIELKCSLPLRLKVLNKSTIDSCLKLQNCSLTHGVEIEIVR